MQDIQSIGGGRFFAGAGDRRLRPHHNHQALKCPRCDSVNTKFCYYNNYNLSQPRHFCKSCRRYWTRGGVLRNVPVGGGCRNVPVGGDCRKTKRSNKSKTASLSPQPNNKVTSNSSSDNSSLTNNVNAATPPTEAVSKTTPPARSSSGAVEGSKFLHVSGGAESCFERTSAEVGVLFSDVGAFTNLMTSANDVPFAFSNVNDISVTPFSEAKLVDQTTSDQVDLTVFGSKGNGVFGSLDWLVGSDHGLFDLSNTVDHAYWSQGQWNDQDPPFKF